MSFPTFTDDDPIFKDETVLHENYTPDTLHEREEQIKQYHSAFRPVMNESMPINIFLIGQAGVGKTVATNLLQEQVAEDQDGLGVSVRFLDLNCEELDSSYSVACNLVNQFRVPENQIATTGHPMSEVLSKLWRHVEDVEEDYLIFVLDEIDNIGTDDTILYQLSRANSEGMVDPDETRIGTIGIANNFNYFDRLSVQTKDSLKPDEIHFTPYNANELSTILEHRAQKAFKDDAYSTGAIKLAAAKAANESGSARDALDFLHKAGRLARQDGDDEIDDDHVERAEPLVKQDRIATEIRSLPMQGQVVLHTMLTLNRSGEVPARTKAIYSTYLNLAENLDIPTKSKRAVRNRLGDLQMKGLITMHRENKGLDGGRFDVFEFSEVDPGIIADILYDVDRFDGYDDEQVTLKSFE